MFPNGKLRLMWEFLIFIVFIIIIFTDPLSLAFPEDMEVINYEILLYTQKFHACRHGSSVYHYKQEIKWEILKLAHQKLLLPISVEGSYLIFYHYTPFLGTEPKETNYHSLRF